MAVTLAQPRGPSPSTTMEKLLIEGGVPLSGTIVPAGNKNAALPLLACSLLTDEEVVLHNVPRIRDVEAMLELLADLGVRTQWKAENTVSLQADAVTRTEVSAPLAERIRASFLAAGPLLSRFGSALMPPPGGDVIGRRRRVPHLDAFRALGATVEHGDRERAHGLRPDRRHDGHPQRGVRAARAGPRPDAQQDGHGDRGDRL